MDKFKFINLKEDYTFKYVFGKNDIPNRAALKCLIQDFTKKDVNHLQVMSEELKCGTKYAKNTIFDIYAKFNEGNSIDIEMQMVNRKNELQPRMLYYLSRVVSSQLKHGEDYTNLRESYILLFTDFKMYEDDRLFHDFGIYDADGLPFDKNKQYIHIYIVELTKIVNKKPITDYEKWAFLLKHSNDITREKEIRELMKEKEGIFMAVQAANKISEDELEWFKEFQEDRASHEEASFKSYTRQKIEYQADKKRLENCILAVCDILSPEEIAKRFKVDLYDVLSIINLNRSNNNND